MKGHDNDSPATGSEKKADDDVVITGTRRVQIPAPQCDVRTVHEERNNGDASAQTEKTSAL